MSTTLTSLADKVTHFYRHALADPDDFDDLFTQTFVIENPLPEQIPFAGIYSGRLGVTNYMRLMGEHLKIETFKIHNVWIVDNTAIVTGMEKSHFIHNTGAYAMEWIHTLEFDQNGRYARLREYNDTAKMLTAYQFHNQSC